MIDSDLPRLRARVIYALAYLDYTTVSLRRSNFLLSSCERDQGLPFWRLLDLPALAWDRYS